MSQFKELSKSLELIIKQLQPLASRHMDVKLCLDSIKGSLNNEEFRITVVGEFSSGKSTFLNAIIGKSVLPSAVKETTAKITYIHNVNSDSPLCNKVKITRYSGNNLEVDLSDKISMRKYSTCLSKDNEDLADVESVDIYVDFKYTDAKIVLIDTPGLNGIAEGHKNMTINEVERSHASIFIFGPKGISETDMWFMKTLTKYQTVIFFVQNFIDELKADEGETPEIKIKNFKENITKYFYDGKQKPKYVFGISALKALVARDKSIKRLYQMDTTDVTETDRSRYLNESMIEPLESTIFKFVNAPERIKSFFESLLSQINTDLSLLSEELSTNLNTKNQISKDTPELTELKAIKEDARKRINRYREVLPMRVNNRFDEMENDLNIEIKKDVARGYEIINDKLSQIKNKTDLQNFIDKKIIDKAVMEYDVTTRKRIQEKISKKTKNIIEELYVEIKHRIPQISLQNRKDINTSNVNLKFSTNEDLSIRGRLQLKEQEIARKQRDIEIANMDLSRVQKDEQKEAELYRNLIVANKERVALGSRPIATTVTVVEKVRKGFCGRLYGALTGSGSYKEVMHTETDDSAGRVWDIKYRSAKEKCKNCEEELRKMRDKMTNITSDELKAKIRQMQLTLDKKRQEFESEKEHARKMMENSITQAIAKYKRETSVALKKLFDNEILSNYLENVHNTNKYIIKLVSDQLLEYYNERTTKLLKNIDVLINNANKKIEKSSIKQEIKSIESDLATIKLITKKIDSINNGLRK